jgi:outer membrane protein
MRSGRKRAVIGLAACVGTLLGTAGAFAQTPTQTPATQTPAAQTRATQTRAPAPPRGPAAGPGMTPPHTLAEALSAAYASNPQLQAARAQLRATDEQVPQALAGWRPTVTIGVTGGWAFGNEIEFNSVASQSTREDRPLVTATGTITQPIYRGGKTKGQTDQAVNADRAQRASLIATEQQVFTTVINAYVGVVEARQAESINRNNVEVLTRQLQATNDRFRVGEITRTDVAQAEAALAGAQAQLETAIGNTQTALATYVQAVGFEPGDLTDPQPLALPVKTQAQAVQLASANNPNVIAAQFNDSAARDAIDVAFSSLMPTLNLQVAGFDEYQSTVKGIDQNGGQVVANVSVPIYQGGAEYAAIRAARQTEQQQRKNLDNARRTAVQAAIQAWQTLIAARATVQSTRVQIQANAVALEGVEREAIVGSRTTLDVLNAQQALLESQLTLVQNLASLVTASYAIADAAGRLTARDLNLAVPIYDETAYYNAVKDRLFGTGDYATTQPGR